MSDDFNIKLEPVGILRSELNNTKDVAAAEQSARLEIFPQYQEALQKIEENSHLWLLLWFHKADRNLLCAVPRHVNPNFPEYGVFGLRSPHRPNPIALTLVRLVSVEGNNLIVQGADAIDGTPVLDIKSYYEQDIITSPKTPYIRALDPIVRRNIFIKRALAHHQEKCSELLMAVRMALVADEYMGHLNRPDLQLTVTGSPCLADTLQGLSRARIANPPRFSFQATTALPRSTWRDRSKSLTIEARDKIDESSFTQMADKELFHIVFNEL